MKKSKFKNSVIIFLNFLAIAAFVLILIFSRKYQTSLAHAILFGFLIGLVVASISAYIFEFVVNKSVKIFTGLTDYVAILLKPFLIFFIGYLMIALLYGGLYNIRPLHSLS